MIGRQPLGSVFDALRSTDSHPPLDYLLRLPAARAGAGDLVMRLPSFVFSVASLGLFRVVDADAPGGGRRHGSR